jgi:hypothetical protein
MRTTGRCLAALGLVVVVACGSGGKGDDRGDAAGDGSDGSGETGETGASTGAGSAAGFIERCPSAEDVGERVDRAVELTEHHDGPGVVHGQNELICQYESDLQVGLFVGAWRSIYADEGEAAHWQDLGDFGEPGEPNAPDQYSTAEALTIGDGGYLNTEAAPDGLGGFRLSAQARVRLGQRLCGVDVAALGSDPALSDAQSDTAHFLVAALCGL